MRKKQPSLKKAKTKSSLKKKSWQEKLNGNKKLPKVFVLPQKLQARWGKGKMVVPAPLDVDSVMKKVARGKVITINEIRKKIAKQYRANICCPVTTGIFAWLAAHAAQEAIESGKKKQATPYWRTLKTGRFLNEKFPGGIAFLKKKLKEEGHHIVKQGKRWLICPQ